MMVTFYNIFTTGPVASKILYSLQKGSKETHTFQKNAMGTPHGESSRGSIWHKFYVSSEFFESAQSIVEICQTTTMRAILQK